MLHGAYLRWLKTQGHESDSEQFAFATQDLPGVDPAVTSPNGWLLYVPELHARRGPGNTCLGALMSAACGRTSGTPINNSKGCGGVMRAAPAGIVADGVGHAFELGCQSAAITHGHPTGWLAGGAFAAIVRAVLDGRTSARPWRRRSGCSRRTRALSSAARR